MEISSNTQETITRYALIIFAILLAGILFIFFSPEPRGINKAVQTSSAESIKTTLTSERKKPIETVTKVAYQAPSPTKPALPTEQAEEQDSTIEMKPDDYKIPAQKNKLTDFLPEELKNNIQESLLTEAQIKELAPEERLKYRETQRKLAIVLRNIGQTEVENQKLQNSLTRAEQQKQELDHKVESLHKLDR